MIPLLDQLPILDLIVRSSLVLALGWLVLLVILLQIPYGIQLRWRDAAAWRPSTSLGSSQEKQLVKPR